MYLIHKCGQRVQFSHHVNKGNRVHPVHECAKCGTIEGASPDLIWVSGTGSHMWSRVKWFFRKLGIG